MPTLSPVTERPSLFPTVGTTNRPVPTPSQKPSGGDSTESDGDGTNSNTAEISNAGRSGPKAPTAAIAAAAGAGLGILAVGLFTLWRCKNDDDDDVTRGKSRQLSSGNMSPSTRQRRSTDAISPDRGNPPPAPPSATSSVARLGARRAPPVPSVVALPEGGEVGSVADSTLGDRTAGRKPPPAVRPPVSILKSSMRHGGEGGWGSSSIAASSQISSLESGTIGAGGDRTLGGFSLEAAIKEDPASDEDEISPDTLFVSNVPADVESKESACRPNIDDAAAGTALLSEAAVREKGDDGKLQPLVGGDTPTESLVGTTSLMGASYQSTIYSSLKEDEKDWKTSGALASELPVGIENSSDGDVTPRASGARITNLNVDLEDGLLFPLHSSDRVEPSSYLPNNLVGDSSLEHSRVASPPPPSLNSTSESQSDSQTSWSDVFAAGTAAILSASFEQAASDDAENEDIEEPTLGVATAPESAGNRDGSQVPTIIGGMGEGFPVELAENRTYPPDFPDSGPLKDANSSDGRDSSEQGIPEEHNAEEDSNNLSEEDPGDWPGHLLKPSVLSGRGDHYMSETGSVVSSIPPPPPDYPPSSESEEGESLISSVKDTSKLFGSSTEGYSSSTVDVLASKYSSSVILSGQHGESSRTQPADVAAGPSSSSGGCRGQTASENTTQKGIMAASEAGTLYADSAVKPNIDGVAIANVAATAPNIFSDENPLEKTECTTPSQNEHSTHEMSAGSPDRLSQTVEGCPQPPLSTKSPVGSNDPIDDENESASSSSSGGNPNPWLIDALTGALGPRGIAADLESLSERSDRSSRTEQSSSQTSPNKSVRSDSSRAGAKGSNKAPDASAASVASSRASQRSRHSHNSTASAKSITSDLIRLEAQLKAIGSSRGGSPVKKTRSFASDAGPQSNVVTPSPPKSTRYIGRRTRISVEAPPGRLGVILANRSDGKGTVVSALRTSSPLAGKLSPGDRLEAIDGEDVSEMKVSDVTAIMARKADCARTLTVVTPGKIRLGVSSSSNPISTESHSARPRRIVIDGSG